MKRKNSLFFEVCLHFIKYAMGVFLSRDPLVTPLKNWWSSTRNSSLTQGSRFGYAGQSEMKWNALSAYLSSEIERVQMRALMIKYRRS